MADLHSDLLEIARNLPEIELKEIKAVSGRSAEDEILESYMSSESHIFYVEGKPAAAFGIDRKTGQIWCLPSKIMQQHPRDFLVEGRKWIGEWRKDHTLWNYILDENEASKRWLSKMGAIFDAPFTWNGNIWRKFVIQKEVNTNVQCNSGIDRRTDGNADDGATSTDQGTSRSL